MSWDDFEKMLIRNGWDPKKAHEERLIQENREVDI